MISIPRRWSRSWRMAVVGALIIALAVPGMVDPPAAMAAEAHAPEGQDFVIDAGDLDYILDQIQLAEGHARRVVHDDIDTSPLCSATAVFDDGLNMGYNETGQMWFETIGGNGVDPDHTTPCVGHHMLPFGLRTVDGRWNNLIEGQDYYGAADQLFPRTLTPEWRDTEPAPSPPAPPTSATSYEQHDDVIYYDAHPRLVSNLIVDQTTNNPAAVAVQERMEDDDLEAYLVPGFTDGRLFFQNVASDEGLSAPFSSWMTYFGQFFDHGLDLVEKGGNGEIIIPLQPNDPLWDITPPNQRFMVVTRATIQPGTTHETKNRTTPFIDQNQTYSSHASHQVFLREYTMNQGRPVPTGRLLDGADGGLATWGDVKTQARTMLGIDLVDTDVLNVPQVHTDPYGRFVPGPANGLPVLMTTDGGVEGNTAAPVSTANAERINHNFLDDIAHDSVPIGDRYEGPVPSGESGYDGTHLDDHFITGDGRGNENIALSAAHHVFHSEHNRLTTQIEAVLNSEGGALRAGYHDPNGFWDYPERLFQAARFVNEMQYQHLAVEEFLRVVAPGMAEVPLNETGYEAERNAAITAEFAHVVYRFGHSMLTETIPRVYEDGSVEDLTLFDGFLSPREFTNDDAPDPDQAAASIIRGLSLQVGNGIDEFVTETLRNELVGLPLDLAAINIARGRDTGMPSLQSARTQIYNATFDPTMRPYEHWADFELAMKNPESLVNYIAAYGDEAELNDLRADLTTGAATATDVRDRAEELIDTPSFMTGNPATTGLNDVDLWMGGLAERTQPFGGMLGSTFNFVFEAQATALQNGDRFYYLVRNHGRNLFAQLEANSFSELIQRNTTATRADLSFDVFAFPDPVFNLDDIDPANPPDDVVIGPNGEFRYTDEEHVVISGTSGNDHITAGAGDDTVWGGSGDDRIEGGAGADMLIGGPGDDIITDLFDDDVILGGGGNDAINGGPGDDLVLAGSGKDFVVVGGTGTLDNSMTFGMGGDDFILGSNASDRIWGNMGDDWIEGGGGSDLLQGDHALGSQNDPRGGHDVIIGGPGNNDFDSDGGDDIMVVNGLGISRLEGMQGFDWVTFKGYPNPRGVNADMNFTGLMPPDIANVRNRFDMVEAVSGWQHDDVLRGVGFLDDAWPFGHDLTDEHLDRVDGLRELLQPDGHENYAARFRDFGDFYNPNNILLGGAGSDLIEGRRGDNFIDGNAWLNVRIEHRPTGENGAAAGTWDSMTQIVDRVFMDRSHPQAINPGDLYIVREILYANDGAIDTAVYSGNRSDYQIDHNGDGYWSVDHVAGGDDGDGSDIVRNIEVLLFANGECTLDDASGTIDCDVDEPEAGVVAFDVDPVQNQPITATVTWAPGVSPSNVSFEWQFEADGTWMPVTEARMSPRSSSNTSTDSFVPSESQVGSPLRVLVTYKHGDKLSQIDSDPTAPVAPDPTEPVDPDPVDPDPVDPDPVDPDPVDPGPIAPGPITPGPVDPAPVDPDPTDGGDDAADNHDDDDASETEDPDDDSPTGGPQPDAELAPLSDTRLSGQDRVATAIAISQATFGDGEADTVVLARSDEFADALAGVPLAVEQNGPLLLTHSSDLHPAVADEIVRVLTPGSTVHLLGGASALAAEIEESVRAVGFETVRLSGADRFETAVRITDALDDVAALLIATGTNFPDALAAGAAAAEVGGAVVLTAGDTVPEPLAEILAARTDVPRYAVGGPATRAVPDAVPISGPDRFATARAVASTFFDDPGYVGLASGETFPDALAGGVRMGLVGGPLLLSGSADLPESTVEWLAGEGRLVEHLIIFGGTAALTDDVVDRATQALRSAR